MPIGAGGLPPFPIGAGGLPPLPTATQAFPIGAGGLPPLPTATQALPIGAGGLPPLPTAVQAMPIGAGGLPPLPTAVQAMPIGAGGLPPLPTAVQAMPIGAGGLPPLPAATQALPIGAGGLPPMPTAVQAMPIGVGGLPPMPTAVQAMPIGMGGVPLPTPVQAVPVGATMALPIGVDASAVRGPGHYTPPAAAAVKPATHTPDGRALDFGPERQCARCQQAIWGPSLDIEGTLFHKECFTCFQCGEEFENGVYILQDGVPYCRRDWANLFAPKCYACQGGIDGNAVELMGRHYHPIHFRCYRCSTDLISQPYVEFQGEPHCEKCAGELIDILPPEAPICSKCKLPIYGEFLRIDGQYMHPEHFLCGLCGCEFVGKTVQNFQEKLYCQECYLKMLAGVCYACQKPIVGLSKQALGRTYHHPCFVCAHCRVPIGETKFFEHKGEVYCTTHYGQLFCDPCNKCGLPVLLNGVTLWGKTFHNECIVCHGCDGPLPGGQFINWEQKPMCLVCFKKLPKKTQKLIRAKMDKEQKQFKKAAAVAAAEHKERQKELAAERALLVAKRAEIHAVTSANKQEAQKAAASAEKDKTKAKKARSKVRYG